MKKKKDIWYYLYWLNLFIALFMIFNTNGGADAFVLFINAVAGTHGLAYYYEKL